MRSSSSAGSKPSRIIPPSFNASGGSSTMAREISSTSSGDSESCEIISASKGAPLTLALSPSDGERVTDRSGEGVFESESDDSVCLTAGICTSAWRRTMRSRALPLPELNRPIVRSRSRTSATCARNLSRLAEFSTNVRTASCRRRIIATAASGCDNQSRKRRAPMGVTVRFIEP